MRRFVFFLGCFLVLCPVFCPVVLQAAGQKGPAADTLRADIFARMQAFETPLGEMRARLASVSPASNLYRAPFSFSSASLGWRFRQERMPVILQCGDGISAAEADVRAHQVLDGRSVAYAAVGYENALVRNVSWNSTSDYLLLYPYVMADTVGGDLNREKYAFRGGYARRDGAFAYGLEASYRALHEYRQRDPRPRNVTADFSFRASAGYVAGGYVSGLYGGTRLYRQVSDIAFYNESGANTSEIPMTGLGSYYVRFSGTGAYLSQHHRGSGWSLGWYLEPLEESGCYASFSWDRLSVERQLARQNSAPITRLDVSDLRGTISWRFPRTLLTAYAFRQMRRGNEMVLDNGANNEYRVLGVFEMYTGKVREAGIAAVRAFGPARNEWTVSPEMSWRDFRAGYLYPYREMSVSGLEVRLGSSWRRYSEDWMFSLQLTPQGRIGLGGRLSIPEEHTEARLSEMVHYGYRALLSDRFGILADLEVGRRVRGGRAISLALRTRLHHYSLLSWTYGCRVELGMNF